MVVAGGGEPALIGLTGRNMAPASAGDGRNGADCFPGKTGWLTGPKTPGVLLTELSKPGTRDPGSWNPGLLIPGFLGLGSWNRGDTFGKRFAEGT